MNVRAVDTFDGRERGGSRPGLMLSHITPLLAAVRMLAPMTLALGDDFTAWSDTFSGSAMADAWTQASWAAAMPSILPNALASIDTSVAEAEAVRDALNIDATQAYVVEALLVPWEGAWHGEYRLYCRLNNTTPAIATEGVRVTLTMTGTTGAYTCVVDSYIGSVKTTYTLTPGTISPVRPGWFSVSISANSITVYWNGVTIGTQAVGAQTGKRVGFGLKCTVDGGLCLANVFRVQYYSTAEVNTLRSIVIASANGSLWKETPYGQMAVVSSSLTVRDDVPLSAVQSGTSLYIADYGDTRGTGTDGSVAGTTFDATSHTSWVTLGVDAHDDVVVISDVTGTAVAGTYKIQTVAAATLTLTSSAGTGNCSYRIERAPKVYDPAAATIVIMTATAGQVPTGCPLIARYNDRIVLAGAEIAPHVWYMSRQSDALDWDYSQTDDQRAVAGTSSDAGVPGDPITALVAHSDDYLIIACRTSLWRLRGDPAFGGSLDSLSRTIGIIGPKAWCLGPDGELIFLSMDGLYALPPGGDTFPVPLSRETLPREFLNVNPDMYTVSLEYDVQGRGVHVYFVAESSNLRNHWWLDWSRKTFWPVALHSDFEPTATCALNSTTIEDSAVILGGRDGYLRRFSEFAETDCAETFTTYVVYGPLPLAPDAQVGILASMDATLSEESGSVTWALRPALTFEGAASASSSDTGTWTAGLNATNYPACRGQACTLKLTGATGRSWAIESIAATVRPAGRRRLA